MAKTIKYIFEIVFLLAFFDAILVLMIIGAIASGQEVNNIPFWDVQIKAVVTALEFIN